MKMDAHVIGRPLLTDEEYLDLAREALAQRALTALQPLLADAAKRPLLWSTNAGQTFLLDLLETILDALSDYDVVTAIDLAGACPASLGETAHNLLLLAFFPDGQVGDLVLLDDAALICLALLTYRMGHRTRATELLDKATDRPLNMAMRALTERIRDHFAIEAEARFKAKLVIWGLDDTLWHGRLADGDGVVLHDARAELILALNKQGIVSAICAQGDEQAVRMAMERHGLWDQFVFPRISDRPRGESVRQLIADMLLQPANILFIDADPVVLAEISDAAPGIRVADPASAECDALLYRLRDDTAHISASRVADYRILEARVKDRQSLRDADFLMQSGIQATYTHRMDNLAFVDRIEELINRADPLNYTETRIIPGTLRDIVMNVTDYDVFSAFIWDRYGHHGLDGLVGTIVYHRPSRRPVHLAFSCRIMHMGVEDFLLRALSERYGTIDLSALPKRLPTQSSAAITYVPFEDVRDKILASHAPRDQASIQMRVMSDCMSGGFHHYSDFKQVMDFDNIPRIFSLPMMLTDAYRAQVFPEYLVYNPAIDYMEPRWAAHMDVIDPAIYQQAQQAFCTMVIESGRKLLLLLSPEHAADHFYAILPDMTGAALKARDRQFNQLWRDAAARHPERISIVELNDFVTEADMLTHAYHYRPSILQHMTAIVDQWFSAGGQLPREKVLG